MSWLEAVLSPVCGLQGHCGHWYWCLAVGKTRPQCVHYSHSVAFLKPQPHDFIQVWGIQEMEFLTVCAVAFSQQLFSRKRENEYLMGRSISPHVWIPLGARKQSWYTYMGIHCVAFQLTLWKINQSGGVRGARAVQAMFPTDFQLARVPGR